MKRVLAALGKAACYTLLFLGAQLLVSMAATLALGLRMGIEGAMGGGMPDVDAMMQTLTQALFDQAMTLTLFANVFTLGVLWIFFATRKKRFLREISFQELPALSYVPLSVGGAALAVTITIILSLLPIPQQVWEEYAGASSSLGQTGFWAVLSSVLISPVAEEVVFRGLVYTRLRRAMPPWVAAVLASLVFASLHGQILWAGYAFVMGLALTLVLERTGSIAGSIAVHIAFNAVGGYLLAEARASALTAALCAAVTAACWVWLCRICPYTRLRPEKRD